MFPESVRERALGRLRLVVSRRADGAPVPGAVARVYCYEGGRFFFAGAAPADGAGRAALDGLPLGPAWILIDGVGFARRSAAVVTTKDGVDLTVALDPSP